MKKRTLKLTVFSLMMAAMLVNCKDKSSTDPSEPDSKTLDEMKNLDLPALVNTKPAAVVSTPGGVVASAKATALTADLAAMATTGVVPASVAEATSAVSAAIPAEDIATVSGVSSTTLTSLSTGGTLPADLAAILAKAKSSPALAAYLPVVTLPTVNGVTLKGTLRVGSIQGVDKVDKALVDDNCVALATAAYNTLKTKLDATKAAQVAQTAAAYAANIAPIAGDQVSCVASATASYAQQRTAALALGNSALAFLDANQAALGDSYALLKAQTFIALLDNLSSLNTVESAEKQACVAKATAATTNAAAAQAADLATIDKAYTAAIAQGTALKETAIKSCHNQGSGI